MPIQPDGWREFVRAAPVLAQRQQTYRFLLAEGISPVPLLGGSKMYDTATRIFEDWLDRDLPAYQNWAMPLSASPAECWLDIDLDQKPLPGIPLTPESHAQMLGNARMLQAALDKLGAVPHLAFGRLTMGAMGHWLVHCLLHDPEDLASLRRLSMVKPVAIRDVMVRLEVRLIATKGDPKHKTATLPGSTYMSPDGSPFDLIAWAVPNPHDSPPKLTPGAFRTLQGALYGWMVALAASAHWTEGNRHQAALYFAGILAHETKAGLLDDDGAKRIWGYLLDRLGDPDRRDRQKVFEDTFAALGRGQPVSGYKKLVELVGEEVQKALLRLRGGSDPDAIAEMFRRIVSVAHGLNGPDVYMDLAAQARLHREVKSENLIQRYSNHPDFPPLPAPKGKSVEIIRVVLRSTQLQRVDGMVELPGIPYGTRFWRDDRDYLEIDPDSPPPSGAQTFINVAEGLPPHDQPTEAEAAEWRRLWDRHLGSMTNDDDAEKLDQAIAHKVQAVRTKHPLGVAICGGQGIGKSAIFDVILRALYGDQLVGKTSGFDLKEKFRLQRLSTSLFYVVEEVDFVGLDSAMHELFKDLCKNAHIPVEHKYGRKGLAPNVALPFFLTNSPDPRIIVDGRPERALLVVKGTSHFERGGSLADWITFTSRIRGEVTEFHKALDDPRLRNAGRHYFANIELDPSIFEMTVADTPPEHILASMTPLMQCVVDMLAQNAILPERADVPLTGPFTWGLIAQGLEARMDARKLRAGHLSPNKVSNLFRDLFNEDVVLEKQIKLKQGESPPRLRYLRYKLGTLVEMVQRNRGINIEFDFEIGEAQRGHADEPSKESCLEVWRKTTDPHGQGGY
jgi:hypothetical protein